MLDLLHKKCKLGGVRTWSNDKKCKHNLWRLPYQAFQSRNLTVVYKWPNPFLSMNLNGASLLYPCHTPQWHSVSRLKAIVLVAGGRGWARAADFRQNYACSSRELRKLWKAPASRRNAAAMPPLCRTPRCDATKAFVFWLLPTEYALPATGFYIPSGLALSKWRVEKGCEVPL